VDIIGLGEIVREDIQTSAKENLGYCEVKQHKPCFDEEHN
jgi:hypothetical protein